MSGGWKRRGGGKERKMKEVKSIDLVLENCEVITIDKDQIGLFHCKDITATISRIASDSIAKQQYCGEFYMEIHKNADRHYNSFGFESDKTVFERLAYADITCILITYEDGTSESCVVPWKDGDRTGTNNEYQTSHISKCGNMHICICKDKSIGDMFNSVLII